MSQYLLERRKQKLGVEITKEVVKDIPNMSAKKRSKKMTKEMKEYNKERKLFLKENPICPVTGKQTTDIHHKKGRTGALLLNKKYWLAVSREGHKAIEENPEWAKQNGFSISRLSKTVKKK